MSDLLYSDYFCIVTSKDTTCQQILVDAHINTELFSVNDLWNVQDNNGIFVNRKSIFQRYNDANKKDKTQNDEANMNNVKLGTKIRIKKNCFIDNYTVNLANGFEEYDLSSITKQIKPFWSSKIEQLYKQDIERINNWSFYKKCNDIAYVLLLRKKMKGLSDIQNEKGFNFNRLLVDYDLMDLTPYVISCSTGNAKLGGKWQLQLAPILGKLEKVGEKETEWKMAGDYMEWKKDRVFNYYQKSNRKYSTKSDSFISKLQNYRDEKIGWYFEKIISLNDLIVIKFDEPFKNINKIGNSSTDANDPDQFDMLGLVDTVGSDESINMNETNVNVSVSGRDFIKLLVEDGTYFYPNYFNTSKEGKNKNEWKIEDYNKCIINSQATLNDNEEVDEFFGHRKFAERIFGQIPFLKSKKYWRVNDMVREIIRMISVINLQVGNKNNSYMGTTRTDLANEVRIENGELVNSGKWDKNSIWNFVEVYTDETSVGQKNRILYDDSITTSSGSVISFLQRVCQEPFVELFTDTWFEKFSIIVRQPPLTMQAYKDNITVEVGDEWIIRESTKYDDSKAFSWFRLDPVGIFFGDQNMRLVNFPAIFLDEFASVFGAKKREYVSNYLGSTSPNRRNKQTAGVASSAYVQAYHDTMMLLKGLCIEPFMKSGTIEMYGNRYIRRGTNIYLKDRDMLYYVEQVQQVSTLEQRKTIATVSRGIKLSDIDLYDNVLYHDPDPDEQKKTEMQSEEEKLLQEKKESTVGETFYKQYLSSIKVQKMPFLKLYLKKIFDESKL